MSARRTPARILLCLGFVLLLGGPASAGSCPRSKDLPADLPILPCPKRVRTTGCTRCGPRQQSFELVYQGDAAQLAAAWNRNLRHYRWKVTVRTVDDALKKRGLVARSGADKDGAHLGTAVRIGHDGVSISVSYVPAP